MEANRNSISTGVHNRKAAAHVFCEVCGKHSQVPICGACADGFAPRPSLARNARTRDWSNGFRGFSVAARWSRVYLYFLQESYFQWE